MKKTLATFIAVVAIVIALHAFRVMNRSAIHGKLTPAHRAGIVWAIGNGDTLKTRHYDGEFNFTVEPGTWKLVFKGNAPFQDIVLYANAEEGKTVDLGEISMN